MATAMVAERLGGAVEQFGDEVMRACPEACRRAAEQWRQVRAA